MKRRGFNKTQAKVISDFLFQGLQDMGLVVNTTSTPPMNHSHPGYQGSYVVTTEWRADLKHWVVSTWIPFVDDGQWHWQAGLVCYSPGDVLGDILILDDMIKRAIKRAIGQRARGLSA